MTIQNAQTKVDEWIKTIGVKYFSELTNLGILMEEVGELSRHMVRIFGEQSSTFDKTRFGTHVVIPANRTLCRVDKPMMIYPSKL